MTLKQRFFQALIKGQLGIEDQYGFMITKKEFTAHFKDIKPGYSNTFLATAVMYNGLTHTQYLSRIKTGVYRVHPVAIKEYLMSQNQIKDHEQMQKENDKQKFVIFNQCW